ncbi:hypothetical protein [Nannocystis pusilla]|uniref:hypothetical protein n=1 Tax=Nannocystis pusilla TaxID=889268 RepID=UPI003B79283D
MLLYPGFTMLDLIGPQSVLAWAGTTHLVAKTMAPVESDSARSCCRPAPWQTARATSTCCSCPAASGRLR